MPRVARRDAPGVVHHVILRGIERREIFRDDADRSDLLQRLTRVLSESGTDCFGFAFMDNHFHLVVRTGEVPLSVTMKRVGTGYAVHFNRRHARSGHLFQNRFKNVLVEDDDQLRTLVRYVHLNPVRAGIVAGLEALERYPWTGHAALVGRCDAPFVSVAKTLALFGEAPGRARARLRSWMSEGLDAAASAGEIAARQPDFERLIAAVAREFGVPAAAIARGVRRRNVTEARGVLAHLACDGLGWTDAEAAARLGVGASAIPPARRRGRALMAERR